MLNEMDKMVARMGATIVALEAMVSQNADEARRELAAKDAQIAQLEEKVKVLGSMVPVVAPEPEADGPLSFHP